MAILPVYNREGEKTEDFEVSEDVFNIKKNDDLVHQAFVTIASNLRIAIAHTKNRGERSGSGKKPWKQKGTGNARVGSVRNPVWRKGGIIFGPTKDKNFSKKINKKMNQKAIKIVLSGKARQKEIIVLEELDLKEKKTKEFARIIKNLKLKNKILFGFMVSEKNLNRYSRNIENIANIATQNLNVFDMLNNKYLLLSKDSVKYLDKKYATSDGK